MEKSGEYVTKTKGWIPINRYPSIEELKSVDIFEESQKEEFLVGRPFYIDYESAILLIADSWKEKVNGIPPGSFLLAFYENEENTSEALLLRALKPAKLPMDGDSLSSMIECYKDDLKTAGLESQLDVLTKSEFGFSGLECRILGTFYKQEGKTIFGADVENYYSANNYNAYKPEGKALEYIVNLSNLEKQKGTKNSEKIGEVRYSSSTRFQYNLDPVPVYINPKDFLGKRTALFGMTRTGKSNSVKKIIQTTACLSKEANEKLLDSQTTLDVDIKKFDETNIPKFPVGQIIFDVNGEYANANLQDEGTAIFELFKEDVERFSVVEKEGFKVLKTNFFKEILTGFELVKDYLKDSSSDYIKNFLAINLEKPENDRQRSEMIRCQRRIAAYQCILYVAGFDIPAEFETIRFQGNKEINQIVQEDGNIDPTLGITLEQGVNWFTAVWENYENEYFNNYKKRKGHEWADDGLKALLVMLTRSYEGKRGSRLTGYGKLNGLKDRHSSHSETPFINDIKDALRAGKIVIVDLSQGKPEIQKLYSERLCNAIFQDSMDRFVANQPNNFIQFYFEEAHNLFPKKEDKNLDQIYNRIAKEGAKLNLGLLYATQEVSSISANILKNTQNWFISHLNNNSELRELENYYDFVDFSKSLLRFSPNNDKGFVRMKMYSNPFVVPVQIDRFTAKGE